MFNGKDEKNTNEIIVKIRIREVNKAYNVEKGEQLTVLKDINLSVEKGDFVVILGESGCGKSTLLNLIAGLSLPSSGEIWIDDRKVDGPHSSVSMLFQQPTLLPWLNVEENVAFGCRIRGELTDLTYRVNKYIKLVGLSGVEKRHPTELSVGMGYRVCLARALIGHPEVFLLDEPFSALDTFTRTRLQKEIINIWLDNRFTVFFVTHDIDEAISMGKRIVLLGGKPCRIKNKLDIPLKYPRDIKDESFFYTRKNILEEFEKTIASDKTM